MEPRPYDLHGFCRVRLPCRTAQAALEQSSAKLQTSERIHIIYILTKIEAIGYAFYKALVYYFKYRRPNAQAIEMLITAFLAGQIYERTDEDLSDKLHPYDHG